MRGTMEALLLAESNGVEIFQERGYWHKDSQMKWMPCLENYTCLHMIWNGGRGLRRKRRRKERGRRGRKRRTKTELGMGSEKKWGTTLLYNGCPCNVKDLRAMKGTKVICSLESSHWLKHGRESTRGSRLEARPSTRVLQEQPRQRMMVAWTKVTAMRWIEVGTFRVSYEE